jgi:hypothetical protein
MKGAGFLMIFLSMVGSVLAKDPFSSKEDAVGYIVIDNHGIQERYIVLESKEGGVKLIRTEYEPQKVLKKGGKKK